jgi:hypothetical protein
MTQNYSREADCRSVTQRIFFLPPKISLLCSQKSVTESYHEPVESNLYSHTFSWMHFLFNFSYKESLHVRGPLWHFVACWCFGWALLLPAWISGWMENLVGILSLLIQYILSYLPYQDIVSICGLKKRHVVVTKDPLKVLLPSSR